MDEAATQAQSANSDIWQDFIIREDLADELGVTTDTLARWATQGAGPDFLKIGRRVYYPKDSVRAWLKTRVIKRASPS